MVVMGHHRSQDVSIPAGLQRRRVWGICGAARVEFGSEAEKKLQKSAVKPTFCLNCKCGGFKVLLQSSP